MRPTAASWLVLAIVGASGILQGPVAASHGTELATLVSVRDTTTGGGWGTVHLAVQPLPDHASRFDLWVGLNSGGGNVTAWGIAMRNTTSDVMMTLWLDSSASPGSGVIVDVEPVPGVGIHFEAYEPPGGCCGGGAALFGEVAPRSNGAPVHLELLFWARGADRDWRYGVRGDPTVQLVGQMRGADTFAYTSRDFEGPLRAIVTPFGVGAEVQMDSTLALPLTDRSLSYFFGFGEGLFDLGATSPEGAERPCPCVIEQNDAPGTWTLHSTDAGVGILVATGIRGFTFP